MSDAATPYSMAPRPVVDRVQNPGGYETATSIGDVATMAQYISVKYTPEIALVSIALYFETEVKNATGRLVYADPDTSTLCVLQSLRPLVRRTDVVYLFGHTLHFLLLGSQLQGGEIVQNRLWDAVLWRLNNTTDGEIIHPCTVAIGHSAYPIPYETIGEFIEAASDEHQRSSFVSGRKTPTRPLRAIQHNRDEDDLPALARRLGIPYLSLLPRLPRSQPERVQQLMNPRLAHELNCYPLGRERNVLTVAMSNPQDRLALERLQRETGFHIFPVLTPPEELQAALEQLI
jgi:Type II secretion system (T2SS), protein E, N-terminal domain